MKCNECGAIATYFVPEDVSEDISQEETYWCYTHAQAKIGTKLIVHWKNPWEDAIPVPIEELVACAHGIGERWRDVDDTAFIMTKERMLEHWKQAGDKLDAYILPCVSGWHCIGIRYGAEGSQYLSPMGDKEKVTALLRKYT